MRRAFIKVTFQIGAIIAAAHVSQHAAMRMIERMLRPVAAVPEALATERGELEGLGVDPAYAVGPVSN